VTAARKRIARVLATLSITALGGSMLIASPTFADPSIRDVQARVDNLYHQAEIAAERYNDARVDLTRAQARLESLHADLRRQQRTMETVRKQVVSSVLAQSQGQVFSSATQIAVSDDPDAFLEQLVTVSQYNDQLGQMKAEFVTQAKQLELRQQDAKRELAQIAETKQKLAAEKSTIDEKAGEAKDLLGRLKDEAAQEAAQRAARASRDLARTPAPSTPSPSTAPVSSAPVSGRAGAAVSYALAQVGDAYVWAATGPDAFDCSGLTMMAWAQAGVSLPHSSSQQMSSGTSVSSSNLQPGDLVFYYSPVSHVGIYIGNGKIVHAANPSEGVTTAPVFSMPFSGAVRPG